SLKLYHNMPCPAAQPALITLHPHTTLSPTGEYETPHGASPTAAHTYYWVATYSGDANNKEAVSGCADEPVAIGQASPSIETTQNPSSGIVGATFKDKATLAGAFGEHVGGTISFKLYDNKSCSAAEGGLIASDGPVNVSANGEYETPHGASPTAAHTYYWVATYSGDANNKEARSGCADEPITVNPRPAIAVLPAQVISGLAAPHGP